jgi:phage terminase large subunit-like protein
MGKCSDNFLAQVQGDRVIAEVNQGGDMVEHTLRTVDDSIPFKKVHASRGKQTRAEPIAALYEKKMVHHVGIFPDLEDQMCNWIPGEKSPDRMDALVWALTELMLTEQDQMFIV